MQRDVMPMLQHTLRNVRKRLKKLYYNTLTRISPTLNSKALYRNKFGKPLDLKNPQAFNEKLMWLKLRAYRDNPLVTLCADKYAVREYLTSLGFGHLLNELYAVYDRVDDIRWSELPEAFVMKWNFGCKYTILCTDKSNLDVLDTVRTLKRWGRSNFHLYCSEMQYQVKEKKIVCERFIETEGKVFPDDYKIYCFNGNPVFIGHFIERDKATLKARTGFFNFDWEPMNSITKTCIKDVEKFVKPRNLGEMQRIARILCQPFPFVRIDFYEQGENIIFGEFTFTPSACLATYFSEAGSRELGRLLALPEL